MNWLSRIFGGTTAVTAPAEPPPRLRGNGKFSVEVVGESYHTASFAAAFREAIAEDHEDTIEVDVELVLDDANPHDKNAVAVNCQGMLLGYLARKMAADFRAALVRDGLASYRRFRVGAEVYLGGDDQMFSVRLDLPET